MKSPVVLKVKLFATTILILFIIAASGQDVKQLIEEGVALHDKGAYDEAIKKYDEALAREPSHCLAKYEKAYSLIVLKKYDDCEKLLKQVLKECEDQQTKKLAYVSYGTVLDYKGDAKSALKIYDRGIKEFPDSYLLFFNKGITQLSNGNSGDAALSFQKALQLNPFHASSHNALAQLYKDKSRIKAMISLFTFLLIEPQGARASQNLQLFNGLLKQGISQKDGGNTVISIDAALLDPKKKPSEDDFSASELMLSLLGANDQLPDSLGANTDGERLSYKMQLLFGGLGETGKKSKGFYSSHYLPFLIEMKEKDFITTACYIVIASTEKDETLLWLDQHKKKLGEFNDWLKNYMWSKDNHQ